MFNRAILEMFDSGFSKALRELTELPTVEKSTHAIKYRSTLLSINYRIPEVLKLLTPDEQRAFMLGSKDVITSDNIDIALAHMTNVGDRREFIIDQEDKVTPGDLVSIALALFPEPKDRLAYILERAAKVTDTNFALVAKILADEDQEKFIKDHQDRLSVKNMTDVLVLIDKKNRFAFLQENIKHVTEENLVLIVGALSRKYRWNLVHLDPKNIKASNIAVLSFLLPEKARLAFLIKHAAQINHYNLVNVLKSLTREQRTVILVQQVQCVTAANFGDVTGLLPAGLQLEFFQPRLAFLKSRRVENKLVPAQGPGVWLENIAKLTQSADRFTVITQNPIEIINPKDIFTLVWAMEILSPAEALKLGLNNRGIVNTGDDFIALASCKTLTFAGKLELIEVCRPYLLQDDQVFKVRKFLAEQLSKETGKQYPRGDKSDLQALAGLINSAKAHLGINKSMHDPRVFGGLVSGVSSSVAMEVSQEKRFTV